MLPALAGDRGRGDSTCAHTTARPHAPPAQVADVARAFEVILHRGVAGKIYNIGGATEKANIEVAKDLLRLMGKGEDEEAQARWITFVEDRAFNDLRYTVNSSALKQLGWREAVPWGDGLQATIDWYRDPRNSGRWGSIEDALVAHPSGGPFRTQSFVPHAVGARKQQGGSPVGNNGV